MLCAFCKTKASEESIGFRDECPKCGGDLHICRNCRFYAPHAANQCREPAIPEPVRDKERRNLCEYFKPAGADRVDQGEAASAETRRQLEALFKK